MSIILHGYTAILYLDTPECRYDVHHLDGTFTTPEKVIDAMVEDKAAILLTFDTMDCPGYSETAIVPEWEDEVSFDPQGNFDRMIVELRQAVARRRECRGNDRPWDSALSEEFPGVIVDIKPVVFVIDDDKIVDSRGVVYTPV